MNRQEVVTVMAGNAKAAMQLLNKCKELSKEYDIPFEFNLSSEVDDADYQNDGFESSFESSWESSNC